MKIADHPQAQTAHARTAHAQTAQRVKVGMIGLAAVVLLIGLASAIFSSVSRERPIAAIGAPRADTVANMATASNMMLAPPNEPLAELGVAPSTVDGNGAVPAARGSR